jgi:ubiquinone/menaquinone biosynthesis C-methylase UbiE
MSPDTRSPGTAWQDGDTARRFLEERRGAIPFGAEQTQMLLQVVRHFRPAPRTLVDLGCGDGFLARSLLGEYAEARAHLLDHSEPMLERAREAMAPWEGRCTLQLGDLADALDLPLQGVDLVVSGYAIHHLPHARKRTLYREIYALLAPGGLFVNVEHVASATPRSEALFDTLYIDHIARWNGKPRPEVEHAYHTRPDKKDNILAPVWEQMEWLRECGFREVDCYFKWLELAVFGGVRPAE